MALLRFITLLLIPWDGHVQWWHWVLWPVVGIVTLLWLVAKLAGNGTSKRHGEPAG